LHGIAWWLVNPFSKQKYPKSSFLSIDTMSVKQLWMGCRGFSRCLRAFEGFVRSIR
jgi:hypothetical protein